MEINKLETWFGKLWIISTGRKCASHALLWFPSSMVDAKQTIRDINLGWEVKRKKQEIIFAGL